MNNYFFSLVAFFMITFSGIFAQNGFYKTEYFDHLIINKQMDVVLVQSDSSYFNIKSSFNMEKFSYQIQNNTLSFDVSGAQNLSLEVEIGSPSFKEIKVSGASDVNTASVITGHDLNIDLSGASNVKMDLNYTQLFAQMNGASDLKITGRADSIYLHLNGASDFDGFNASNTFTSIQATGASDAKVNTDSLLVADLKGSSSLKFKKNPAHQKVNSGEMEWVDENSEISMDNDTDTIKITTRHSNSEIIITDKDGDYDIKTRKLDKPNKYRGNWAGLELGINGYLNDAYGLDMPAGYEFLELNYNKSTNFNLNFFQQSVNLYHNHIGLVTGMGIHWNNYRFDNNVVLVADSSTIYGYGLQTQGYDYEKSKLTLTYLVIPLLIEYQTNSRHETNSFHISAGVIGALKMISHTKMVYTDANDGTYKPKNYDDFHIPPFKLDATVRIGWGPINLFATYALTPLFRNGGGPELYPFTMGLILPFEG